MSERQLFAFRRTRTSVGLRLSQCVFKLRQKMSGRDETNPRIQARALRVSTSRSPHCATKLLHSVATIDNLLRLAYILLGERGTSVPKHSIRDRFWITTMVSALDLLIHYL